MRRRSSPKGSPALVSTAGRSRHGDLAAAAASIMRRAVSGLKAVGRGDTTVRDLQIALGVVWLVDGGLQLQPFMFTRGFVTQILEPSAAGQPAPLAHSILAMAHYLQPHLVMWNALFALLQLAIGVGLCFRRSVKPALVVSFVWSLLVWWLAEGLGGVLTGSASPLTGAPGAALLYVVVGLCAWPRRELAGAPANVDVRPQVELGTLARAEPSGALGTWGARVGWCAMWLGFAALTIMPDNVRPSGLSALLASSASGEPGPLGSLDRALAHLVGGNGMALSILLAVAEVAIGIGAVSRWHPRGFIVFGAVVAVMFWIVGQDFGGVFSGQGTDPNSGPLVLLLGVAAWGALGRPMWSPGHRSRTIGDRVALDRPGEPAAIRNGGFSFDA